MTTAARASQTGLALVAIVAVPVLVAQTAQPEPKPEENKLTVRLTGPERTDAGGRLRLRAADAAPMAPTLLLSADGLDSATVNAVDSKQCARMSIRQTSNAVGGHQWCLEIRGIRDGDELSGVVTGAGDKLTLSVARRAEFFWKPFLVAITGLLVGALVLLVPRSLRTSIRSAVLEQLLDENDAAAASAQIADLRTWVGSRREKGETDDALLPIVASWPMDRTMRGLIAKHSPTQWRSRPCLETILR